MKILFDENIPFGKDAFSTLGSVDSCSGREMLTTLVADYDLLFVRSITPVNANLLLNSKVKFVATATSGSDHIDKKFLIDNSIGFSDAIGSNANSVAEYVVSSLLYLSRRDGYSLQNKTIGIVGVGHVGSLVVQKAKLLGLEVLTNDPPRAEIEADFENVDLEQILKADFVSLHVPLTKDGKHPTFHLLDANELAKMKPDTVLIQSSRGAVVDNFALKSFLKNNPEANTVLDVWENEPNIDLELLKLVDIGTPHIAGYSWISKIRGTYQVYLAACDFLGQEPIWQAPKMPANIDCPLISTMSNDPVFEAVMHVYNVFDDHKRFVKLLEGPQTEVGPFFDSLRKNYPIRLEFSQTNLDDKSDNKALASLFEK